jgi:hypothetical protein
MQCTLDKVCSGHVYDVSDGIRLRNESRIGDKLHT